MRVSVVIPCFNVGKYLADCIDSVMERLPFDFEVIMVNDGSTDDTLLVMETYKIKYPKSINIINQKNGGLSDARNVGTEVAQGEYICYIDSDDWISSDAIMKLYDFAVENQCEIVQCGFYYAYKDYLLYDDRYLDNKATPFILDNNTAMHERIKNKYIKNFAWGKLYKADLVKKYKFPKGRFYEDCFWQHLIIHDVKHYGVIPEPMYYYRQNETSISGRFSVHNIDLLIGYKERISFIEKNYPMYSDDIKRKFYRLCIEFNECAIAIGEHDMMKLYADFLREEGVHYNRIEYKLHSFIKRAYNYFFAKKLKKVSSNGI